MYQTRNHYPFIMTIDAERQTEKSVWVDGVRRPKLAASLAYFDTFAEAKAHVVRRAGMKVETARLSLKQDLDHLGNMKGMKE